MKHRTQGFTLVELLITMTVLSVGLLGMAASFLSTSSLTEETRRTDVLKTAMTNMTETLRKWPLEYVVLQFEPSFATEFWCTQDGSIVFEDPGADAIALGFVDVFPDESTIPAEFADLGDGIDLNVDGAVTNTFSSGHMGLPVRILLKAPTRTGDRDLETHLILRRKRDE